MTTRLEAENAQLRARLATLATIAGAESTRLSSTLDRIEADTNEDHDREVTEIRTRGGRVLTENTWTEKSPARATCRMHTARGRRCTAEALDTDPKVIQVCARHAAEVMSLVNERATR